MPKKKDLTGRTFGRLRVICETDRRSNGMIVWECLCKCGATVFVTGNNLCTGNTTSCGCWRSELSSGRFTTHGETHHRKPSREYVAWISMRDRCVNPRNKSYEYYGGRGVSVCLRWMESFEAFLSDVGRCPSEGMSIDRIDTNGNYEPDNVRWATASQQAYNQRLSKRNSSGFKGISRNNSTGKFQAQIGGGKNRRYLGLFETIEDAVRARDLAKQEAEMM